MGNDNMTLDFAGHPDEYPRDSSQTNCPGA